MVPLVLTFSFLFICIQSSTLRPNHLKHTGKVINSASQTVSHSNTVIKNQLKSALITPSRTVLSALAVLTTSTSVKADELAPNVVKSKLEYQPALQGLDYGKPRTFYPDFTQVPSGLQYKVAKEGTGKSPKKGDRVVVDWEGYTIGYYGRPFQTRNKVKGGAFDATDEDFYRWVVGAGTVLAALDEGVQYMKEGGVTQFIVPAELGYPTGDPEHDFVGPKPTTFSGRRALNFVLENSGLIDKTLLINLRLVRVDEEYEKKKGKRT